MSEPLHSSAMARLIERFSRLPGIGKRSAERVAFYLLKSPPDEAEQLAAAITTFSTTLKACSICGHIAESDPCPICADPKRDGQTILVVEQPLDIPALEATGQYRGLYHVLMGRLAPLDGVGPGELNIRSLLDRVRPAEEGEPPRVREVILGMNPTLEGDGTALYLGQQLEKLGARVTRLARGLPAGSNLEILSKAVLSDAILSRQEV
jgi:recombination protein RecR